MSMIAVPVEARPREQDVFFDETRVLNCFCGTVEGTVGTLSWLTHQASQLGHKSFQSYQVLLAGSTLQWWNLRAKSPGARIEKAIWGTTSVSFTRHSCGGSACASSHSDNICYDGVVRQKARAIESQAATGLTDIPASPDELARTYRMFDGQSCYV
jgi:hypothetical protein